MRAPDDVLRVGLPAAPLTLDPRYATDAWAARLLRLLYQAPVDFDAAFMPRPALMTWQQPAPTRYLFTLCGSPRFDDGTPLTAGDVVATYRAVLDPAYASPHRASLANVSALRALDEHSVEFTLQRPDPLFPGLLVIGVMKARDAALPQGAAAVTGSGPFTLGSTVTAKRYPLVRRRDGQRVEFRVVDNETTRALMLARGELDLVQGGFSPEYVRWLAHRSEVTVSRRPGTAVSYLGFNLVAGPTMLRAVRGAVAAAIDRQALVTQFLGGEARLAGGLLVPTHWAGLPEATGPVHDPARARALLAEVGFGPARPLELTLKVSSDPLRLRLATVLRAQLAEAGIALNLRSYEWGTLYGDIRAGRFEMYSAAWVGLQLPDIFRYAFHSASLPPSGANRGHYRSAAADSLIAQAETETALPARAARLRELQRLLARDLPVLPLWYEDVVVVRRARLLGYDTDESGDFDGLAQARLAGTP